MRFAGRVGAIALLCLAHATHAETLEDAWSVAIAADGRLAAATARTDAAAAELSAARAARRPNVAANSSTSRWRDTPAFDFTGAGLPLTLPLFDGNSMTMASAEVSMPLYSGGANTANIAAASAMHAGRSRAAAALLQDVKLAVAEAYIDVLRAASALDIARSSTTSLAAHTRDVEDMRRTGQVPTNDYLAAAVALADAEQRELSARNALDVARAVYNRRLSRPLDAPFALEPVGALADSGASLEALIATAHDNRPELAELAATADALEARAEAARAMRRPQLMLSGGYTYLENSVLNRNDYWSATLGVRWSLFDNGRARETSASFTRQSAAATAERGDLALEIELDVRRAWHALDTARARVSVATAAVEQAEENLRVVRDRYRNGEGTNTEVLDAEALRSLSRGNLDSARYDSNIAQLRLARAIGSL